MRKNHNGYWKTYEYNDDYLLTDFICMGCQVVKYAMQAKITTRAPQTVHITSVMKILESYFIIFY